MTIRKPTEIATAPHIALHVARTARRDHIVAPFEKEQIDGTTTNGHRAPTLPGPLSAPQPPSTLHPHEIKWSDTQLIRSIVPGRSSVI